MRCHLGMLPSDLFVTIDALACTDRDVVRYAGL
jgi:hypothetical protein